MSFIDKLLGRPLASGEEDEQKVGPLAAVPMLGLDGLSSAAYGPEAAMTALIPLGAAGLVTLGPIVGILIALLAVLYFSYRQTMAAYPKGGGSYTVSKENLGIKAGLLSGAALLLDYILVVAVGISAGVGALISAFPTMVPYRLILCLVILAAITIVNLRGIKESGVIFSLPTYAFIVALGITLVWGLVKTVLSGGNPTAIDPPAPLPNTEGAFAGGALLWLTVRAFSSGCTAMTGVEAVSNGMSVFKKPAVLNAQRTLTIIVVVLGILLAGIAYLAQVYRVGATPPEGTEYESVLSQLTAAIAGRGPFYFVVQMTVLAVLALSANTGFADFPRLCRILAEDDFLPHAFANRGRRLVYSYGIITLAVLSALLLIAFGGVTDRLIPLFAIGAFGAFTLSQAGMVVYWNRNRSQRGASLSRLINGFGALVTGIALVVVLAAKFPEGAWITLLLIPVALIVFRRVHRHYEHVARETENPGPLNLTNVGPPIVVVPIAHWSTVSEKALRFALNLSPDVIAVHIVTGEEDDEKADNELSRIWQSQVLEPVRARGLNDPALKILSSPFRRLFHPLLRYLSTLQREHPDRMIAVIIPELVESRWYQYLLHNQRATSLKAALLLRGGNRIVVINVPWYLGASPTQSGKSVTGVNNGANLSN